MKTGIFNPDFFPTPIEVIEKMLFNQPLEGKNVLEPSAGKGDIVDFLNTHNANVIACETSPDLCEILKNKCNIIASDFLTVKKEEISHINLIVMNPPFSADEKHILHAWNIAPDACKIIALCNNETIKNRRYNWRKELGELVDQFGHYENLGQAFKTAERPTEVEVGLMILQKPGSDYNIEFEGFFMEEEPDQPNVAGVMPYNAIRDLVNRYIAAIKLFDEQLETGVKMQQLTKLFYESKLAFSCSIDGKPLLRNNFKKELQKNAWKYIFNTMKMEKFATSGLQADINKFVEQQTEVPFTMRNIYRMIEIVIGTQSQRMDKALLEVFDKVTKHYDENRWNVEGWKTNSHYLVNRKFIFPHLVTMGYRGHLQTGYNSWNEPINDLYKALHYITGKAYQGGYDDFGSFLNQNEVKPGQTYTWDFFEFKAYKKGTVHFKFVDENIWALFNQNIARILGYPLPEEIKPKTKKAQPETHSPIVPITEEPEMVEFSDDDDYQDDDVMVENPNQLCMF